MIFLYGLFWLILLSPFTIFLCLGRMTTQPSPDTVEIIGVLLGSYFYWDKVWMPVRVRFIAWDREFCKDMGWR
ncbi:TMhelix containing protein [Vibrio phage 1.170.O._10N.261.52.C3]|nr:TMhelix containing protein [Vibrio phage 1.170.O._10N.261.52.C3]